MASRQREECSMPILRPPSMCFPLEPPSPQHLRIMRQNLSGADGGPSDQSGETLAQTARRSYVNARRHCESCPPPVGLCHAWGLASEILPAVPVPEWGHCRRPHRRAPAASCGDQGTGHKPLPQAGVPPARATRPRFDSHRWHWLRSPLLPAAWRGRHRLSAAPSRICRDPQG